MEKSPYVIGIDLGTSHSALSYWVSGESEISILEIPQIEAPGQIGKSKVLSSTIYFPHDNELKDHEMSLPWEESQNHDEVIGSWARKRGSLSPERYICSAKSWLCNQLIDRREQVLPWQSAIKNKKSPLEATSAYLKYLKNAFLDDRKSHDSDFETRKIELVLTVPASFDEIARNLTLEAAKNVGFSEITLLEEPQAAFYSWISRNKSTWRSEVKAGDVVLVCDVGGGTCDFSLIAVSDQSGSLKLDRISVGNHLLLGGDNMDLALAFSLKNKLAADGKNLDKWQFLSLISEVKTAKEILLGSSEDKEISISISSRGSSLFAKTISIKLSKEDVVAIIQDGFFPKITKDELPAKMIASGFLELGLGYEAEPAITKHLAKFLKDSKQNCDSHETLSEIVKDRNIFEDIIIPTKILFNGGVFKSSQLKDRVLEVLKLWNSENEVQEICGNHLDLAVAHGAGYFARSKITGHGIRIGSGTARSFYVGMESGMMAVPGMKPTVKGFCVAPQGSEEGVSLNLPKKQFGLQTGQKVSFRFFSSSKRAGDRIGDLVDDAESFLDESTNMSMTLPPLEKDQASSEIVPVFLDAGITETGLLQLYMKHTKSDKKWNLEFNVRPQY